MNHKATGKHALVFVAAVLTVLLFTSESLAWWFIYDKPAFRGKFIDAETKEPIEGAAVAVIYRKYPIIGGPAGRSASILTAKETLTYKNGEFFFPPYTKILHPFAEEADAKFIFFKSGYGNILSNRASPSIISSDAWEKFFSEGKIGEQGKIIDSGHGGEMINVIFGVVEIRRIKTNEERLRRMMGIASDLTPKGLPLLNKAMDEERKKFILEK